MNKQTLIYAAVFLAGVVLANRVKSLPVVGGYIPSL